MLYLVRHGQTDWNKVHKLQGRTDIPLNETGRQMARDTKPLLEDISLDFCYVSPLKRAIETAEILVGEREVPIIVDERLVEMDFGRFEGTTDYYSNQDSPVYPLFHDPTHYDCCGLTESFEQLAGRSDSFLQDVVIPYTKQKKNILVVAHGVMNLGLYNQLYRVSLDRFWDNLMKNCEVRKIDEDVILKTAQ